MDPACNPCRRLIAILLVAAPALVTADFLIREDIIQEPAPEQFSFCQGGSCATLRQLGIPASQWRELRAEFLAAPPDAAAERETIRRFIARMEQLAGMMTHTSGDKAGTFSGFAEPGQLDCIDEATNTRTYLMLLQGDGLLRYHRVANLRHRGFFLFGWPHTAASIEEPATGSRYVVDSWFRDNGQLPDLVPLQEWQAGWSPQ